MSWASPWQSTSLEGGHLDYPQNDDAIYEQLLTNIARIAALHKLHGTSSINVSFVCPFMNHSVTKVSIVLSVLSLVFLSRVTKCLPKWPAWKVSMVVFVRKLEVVHKQVGGCLISYEFQLACTYFLSIFFLIRKLEVIWPDGRTLPRRSLWLMNHEWISHSVS